MKKRWISFALAVALLCTILPSFPIKAEATQSRTENFVKNYTMTGNGATDIVAIAMAQLGRSGSQMGYSENWCANFVGDCAKLAGQTAAVPHNASVAGWTDSSGKFYNGLYQQLLAAKATVVSSPQIGDICFYDWNVNGTANHVEIVYKVSGNTVYTIGGNTGDGTVYTTKVGTSSYNITNGVIWKYVRPNYITTDVKYTLSFASNGGSAISSITADSGTTVTIPSTVPERYGYNFRGWEASNGTVYQPGDSFALNQNMTLTAQWQGNYIEYEEPKSWGADLLYPGVGFYCKLYVPESGLYKLEGVSDFNTKITLWDANGNLLGSDDDSGGNTQFKLTKYLMPDQEYMFYVEPYYGDVTGRIEWSVEKGQKVIYTDPISGTVYTEAFCTQLDVLDDVFEHTISFYTPTRDGYTFLGWSTSTTATSPAYQAGDYVTWELDPTGLDSVYLYPVWRANATELISNMDGQATISPAGSTVHYTFTPATSGTYVIYSYTGTWGALDSRVYLYDENHTQLGADDDGGEGNNFRLAYYMTAGTTYFFEICLWDASLEGTVEFVFGRAYNVSYNANGGSGAPATQQQDTYKTTELSSIVPTREGYTFLGWATSANATTADYQPGDLLRVSTDTTLYAVWKEKAIEHGGYATYSYEITTPGSGTTFELMVFSTGKYRFKGLNNRSLDTTITIYDSNGTQIGFNDDDGGAYQFLLECTLEEGVTYTVVIKPYSTTATGTLMWEIAQGYSVQYLDPETDTLLAEGFCYSCDLFGNQYAVTIPADIPTRSGYAFLGWSRDSDATVATYQPGENTIIIYDNGQFSDLMENPAVCGTAYLYAVWERTAIGGTCGDNLTWTLDEEGTLTISGTGAMYNYSHDSIPWYSYVETIQKVVIEDGVTTIGSCAFYGCGDLTDVTIPDSVTTIGDRAFCSCASMTSVTIPESVTAIGEETFAYCFSLTSVTIPDRVTTIGMAAYAFCTNLTSVTIGDSVTTIENHAFHTCTNLTDVYYNGTVEQWNEISIGSYNNEYLTSATIHTVEPTLTSIIVKTQPTKTEYWVGESLNTAGLTLTATYSDGSTETVRSGFTTSGFSSTSAGTKTVTVTYEGKTATFTVTVAVGGTCGDNLTWTLDDAGTLTISGTGPMYDYEYEGSPWYSYIESVQKVVIENGVTTIGEEAFEDCTSLTSVTIGDGVTTIGEGAFWVCTSLTSVTIPDSVTTIGDRAFYSCDSLSGIWVNADNLNYSNDGFGVLFDKDKKVLIQAPGKLSGSYTIPDSVTTISEGAFERCISLTSMSIPDSITTIGDWAFYECTRLSDVYYKGTESQWNAISVGSGNDALASARIHYNHICDYTYDLKTIQQKPNCMESGLGEGYCVCGQYGETTIPALDHLFIDYISDENAACGVDGTKTAVCDREGCEETDTVTDEGTALDHIFTNYVSDNNATTAADGTKTAVCDREGCEETDTIVDEGTRIMDGWVQEGVKWFYYQDGTKATGWLELSGTKYYLDESGAMVTGEYTIAGKVHKFSSGGKWLGEKKPAKTGWVQDGADWYYYENGVMQTGWLDLNGVKYYLDATGTMVTGEYTIAGKVHRFATSGKWLGEKQLPKTGWVQDGADWYYYQSGVKKTGWVEVSSKWYYLDANGVMQTGWLQLGNTKYYLRGSGAMVTGQFTIEGVVHKFSSGGKWLGEVQKPAKTGWAQESGVWYYYQNGTKVTGWLELSGTKYYLDETGAMVTGEYTIEDVVYKFSAGGKLLGVVQSTQISA